MVSHHGYHLPASRRRARTLAVNASRWRLIRARHLAFYPACSCGRVATEVDHVDNDSGNNVSLNLRSYCKSCHSRKTVRQDGGFGRPASLPTRPADERGDGEATQGPADGPPQSEGPFPGPE